ncbi:MAG TPA: hypothetical protein PKN64_14160, partial [Casimicrobium sp.]|nr:hypothetical protein [Casimicrobium sp.]
MSNRIKQIVSAVSQSLAGVASKFRGPFAATPKVATLGSGFVRRNAKKLIALGVIFYLTQALQLPT